MALAAIYGPRAARYRGASNGEDALTIHEAVSICLLGRIEDLYKVHSLKYSQAIGSYERKVGARRPGPDNRFGRIATNATNPRISGVGYKRRINALRLKSACA